MKTLTDKQSMAFTKAEAKLPTGFSYNLCDTNDKHETVAAWGVELYFGDHLIGYVGKNMSANYTGGRADRALQRALLNRVAAALWHKQPNWGAGGGM